MAISRKIEGWTNGGQRFDAPGQRSSRTPLKARQITGFVRASFAVLALACDFAAIIVGAVACGWIYHNIFQNHPAPVQMQLQQGYIVATLVIAPILLRGEYSIRRYLEFRSHIRQVVTVWNTAFITALTLAFLTKTSEEISRGSAILFYVFGAAFLLLVRLVMVRIVQEQAAAGQVPNRRIFLVGFEEEVRLFSERYRPWTLGVDVVASAVLRDEDSLQDDLALAAASARVLRPEDIFVLVPWSHRETVDACISAFLRVPASIHLMPERILDRFADVQIEKLGPISSLHLVRRPLSTFEIFQKRVFDIVASALGLLVLSPLLLIVAILIKLDSRGPVFFLQRRYGFNQEPFRIYKFRSMTTLEDGRIVTQATR
ncbi:MAG: sugar transferase, partial [Beijerinckiaceae bacterium]